MQATNIRQQRAQVFTCARRSSCRSLLRRSEVSVEHIFIQIECNKWHMVQHFGRKGFTRLRWPPGSINELPWSCFIAWCKGYSFQSLSQLTHLHQPLCAYRSQLHIACHLLRPLLLDCAACSQMRLASNNHPQSPRVKTSNRVTNFSLDITPPSGGRCNNNLGNIKRTFHPRLTRTSSTLATISSRTIFIAFRKGP